MLEGFIINEREAIEFEFVDLFFLKDKKVWDIFKEAIERNVSQILLVSLLFNHAQKLEEYHLQTIKGIPLEEIMKNLKVYPKKQKVFAKQASIYNLASIRQLIAKLYIYDMRLKSYRPDMFSQENPLVNLLLHNSA